MSNGWQSLVDDKFLSKDKPVEYVGKSSIKITVLGEEVELFSGDTVDLKTGEVTREAKEV